MAEPTVIIEEQNMAEITAAPVPIVLNGVQYRMSPLTDRDIAELDNWLRSRVIADARASLSADMPQSLREETLSVAMKVAATMSWMSGEGAKIMASIDGVSRVVWQGLRLNHPDVTHEQLRSMLLRDPTLIEEANAKFKVANLDGIKKGVPRQAKKRPKQRK